MPTYRFTVYLTDVDTATEELADALFEAGCDDGTFGSTGGTAFIHFDREAASLDAAIRTAVDGIRVAGLRVRRIASEESEAIAPLNAEIAGG